MSKFKSRGIKVSYMRKTMSFDQRKGDYKDSDFLPQTQTSSRQLNSKGSFEDPFP